MISGKCLPLHYRYILSVDELHDNIYILNQIFMRAKQLGVPWHVKFIIPRLSLNGRSLGCRGCIYGSTYITWSNDKQCHSPVSPSIDLPSCYRLLSHFIMLVGKINIICHRQFRMEKKCYIDQKPGMWHYIPTLEPE